MNSSFPLPDHLVFQIFSEISKIPRPSGHEQAVIQYLQKFAQSHKLKTYIDSAGNLAIHSKPNHPTTKSPIILQAHADMVAEKRPEKIFDFFSDPIELISDGEWLSAQDTTLGADNGIGLSIALALAIDNSYQKPPLEILVTVEEETTFYGASNLDLKALKIQGKSLINIDNEEENAVFIGNAGMLHFSAITEPPRRDLLPDQTYLRLTLKNLPGGHSGAEIHQAHRVNAILELLQFLNTLNDFSLLTINGGNKDNAIPRDTEAIIEISPTLAFELLKTSPITHSAYPVEIEVIDNPKIQPFTNEFTQDLLQILTHLPNGIQPTTSKQQTIVSSNFASIKTNTRNNTLSLRFSVRSDQDSLMHKHYLTLANLLAPLNLTSSLERFTSGWQGDPKNSLVQLFKTVCPKAQVKTIHAGLEVGEIVSKLKAHHKLTNTLQIPAISLGPTIQNAHTPYEKVHIKSVLTVYSQLQQLLEKAL